MIRYADAVKDKDALVQGLHAFVEYINKPKLFPEQEKAEREEAFMNIINAPAVDTLVDEINGELVGFLGLAIVPHIWNPKHLVADELFWWCVKDKATPTTALRLIRAAHEHCKEHGVHILSMSMMYNSPTQVEQVYTRMGLEKIQSSFIGIY